MKVFVNSFCETFSRTKLHLITLFTFVDFVFEGLGQHICDAEKSNTTEEEKEEEKD